MDRCDTSSKIKEIKENELFLVDKSFNQVNIPYDHVIACWTRPNIDLYQQIKAAGIDVVNIGDSVKPRNLHAAVKDGTTIGLTIEEHNLFNPNGNPINDLPIDGFGQILKP